MAISLWERVLERGEESVNLLTRLGDAYRRVGNMAAAEATFRKNLDSCYDKFSLLGLAKVHAVRGNIDEAVNCYRKLIEREVEEGWYFSGIASQLMEHQRQSDAVNLYKIACELQQNNQEACRKLSDEAKKLEIPV